jgi:hypothetical protein
LLVGALAAGAAFMGSAVAAGDPAKELAALEDEYETSPLPWTESHPAFRPKYEAFAAKYPGTEQALTAKLRLLEFTDALSDDKSVEHAAAGEIVDAILAEYPRSEQLEVLPSQWYLFDEPKFAQVMKALSDPAAPDRVKAALLLHGARARMHRDGGRDQGVAMLQDLAAKYKDVPCRWSTYGEVAAAELSPHEPSSLQVGRVAPDIQGRTADGKPIKLSDFKGRVVVVDFFGDW